MISLHRVAVENYLSLQDIGVTLRDLNVLVGPNGAGKSNFLDAIQFLGDTARLDLQPALESRGGFESTLFNGTVSPKPTTVRFTIEAVVTRYASPTAKDEYTLSFWQRRSLLQRREEFRFERTKGRERRITVNGGNIEIVDDAGRRGRQKRSVAVRSAGLSTLPRFGEDSGADQVRQLAELFQTNRLFSIDPVEACRPRALDSSTELEATAGNLAPYLRWLADEHEDVFGLLEDDLRYFLPGFQHIKLRPVGGASEAVAVELAESSLSRPTPLARASFGTIRALALLAMLHDPNPPQLTCVEEVDHGLHPHALDRLVERLRSACRRTQLIVATHSPALVNRLRAEELIVCERDTATGASRIPAIDPADVEEMAAEDDLRLGELWFSGALGGVP